MDILTNPIVMALLLLIGLTGIASALLLRGFMGAGIVGTAAFAVYFYGQFAAGSASMIDIVLFILGIVMLALELFVPSFGLLSVLGTLCLIIGVVRAAEHPGEAVVSLGFALVISTIIVVWLTKKYKHLGEWNRFILKHSLKTEDGYVSAETKTSLLHQEGESITPLRPAGTAVIGGERVDVVTEGEFIMPHRRIKVCKVEGSRVIVREVIE